MFNEDFAGDAGDNYEGIGSVTSTPVDDIALICDSGAGPWSESGRGLLANEVPFRRDLNLRRLDLVEERLALKSMRKAVRRARGAVIANAIYAFAWSPDTWVFYSRDRNHYAEQARRYSPSYYTYENMMRAVASLEAAGLIEHKRTSPSPSAMCRSRIRAAGALHELQVELCTDLIVAQHEEIILRDGVKGHCDYRDSDRICAMRKDVIAHNDFLARADIRLDHPSAYYDEHGFLRVQDRRLDPRLRAYYRVFNRHWSQGGRWYGPFWQGLPSKFRNHLRIDGEAVVELDYCTCHLRLLCASSAIELPFDEEGYDPFTVPGIARRRLKLAFNIMLNAGNKPIAHGAIADELRKKGVLRPYHEAARLMETVGSCFPGLERFWCSGAGLRLQNIDAEICARVQRCLRRQVIPALSIHDSFIVPARVEDVLKAVMDEEIARACSRLASNGLIGGK